MLNPPSGRDEEIEFSSGKRDGIQDAQKNQVFVTITLCYRIEISTLSEFIGGGRESCHRPPAKAD
jgi:hypothetical protein